MDIPFLKAQAHDNLRQKFVEASKADEIVRQAVVKYLSTRIEVSLKPLFQDSYQESLKFARKALKDLFEHRCTAIPPEEKEAMFELIEKLVGHSAFQPVKMLSNRFVDNKSSIVFNELTPQRKEAV